ncbi:ATP-binding protein [Sorangium sp. So ce854]|uniref:ATP-binding protein n=1 Tax=Sorangium sp. So ce854 TaxID=3133322 RepID=UPI003F61CAFD
MTDLTPTEMKARLKSLGLFGLLACWDELADKPWLREVLAIEERERHKRSLERRIKNSRVAAFKPMADFDWSWPKKIDREAVDDLFAPGFIASGHNAVLVGPNGVGKTMILKNAAHQAVVRGHTVRFSTASDMLADLAAQDSSTALARRLRRYTVPALLCVDEVGYLSYNGRYADLLFEVVTRRYDAQKPILLSTNKAFSDWGEVFPHAACVVTLVDRLVHRAEVIEIEAESYRLKEAKELTALRSKQRRTKKH